MLGRGILTACLIWAALAASAQDVPSGQVVTFHERLVDRDGARGLTWRYRFVAPDIARATGLVGVDTALADIDALCASVVVPEIATADAAPDQVVITLMDRVVAFGQSNPDATQYIEAFRVTDGQCVWDGF